MQIISIRYKQIIIKQDYLMETNYAICKLFLSIIVTWRFTSLQLIIFSYLKPYNYLQKKSNSVLNNPTRFDIAWNKLNQYILSSIYINIYTG